MRITVIVLAALVVCASAKGQTYSVTDLGDFKSGTGSSSAKDINNLGQITMYATDPGNVNRPAVWLPAPAYGLPAGLNNLNSNFGALGANGISDTGYVAADNDQLNLNTGGLTNLGNFPVAGGGPIHSFAANNAGNLTGFGDQPGPVPQAVRWIGVSQPLGGLMGPSGFSTGLDINNIGQGEVVGYSRTIPDRAFCWIDPATPDGRYPWVPTGIFDLGSVNGSAGDTAHANGMNDDLLVVGDSRINTSSIVHGTLWDPRINFPPNSPSRFRPIDLGALLGAAGNSNADDINTFGDVVGFSDAGGFTNHATAWLTSNGMNIIDLNLHLDASGIGWTLTDAIAINDNGWIIGTGTNPASRTHAYLLRPVPEPSSAMVMCAIAVGTMVRRRR